MHVIPASADHITGGEIHYTLAGESGGQYRYSVTLKLFMDCFSNRQFSNPGVLSVFNKATGARVGDFMVALSFEETLNLTNAGPCITNPPPVCYRVGHYTVDITLPASADGYVISSQVNYRVNGISNLTSGYGNVGATYTAVIPGNVLHPKGPSNNSAQFTGNDLVVICANNSFSYDFGATDGDGDHLLFSFCDAYSGGSAGGGGNANPSNPPPYQPVPYGNGYTGSVPLGDHVTINTLTGMITGMAPGEGVYVVTVCVQEVRDGVVIATQRKDLQIKIAACNIAAASLPPAYMLCGSTQTIGLENQSTSPLITSYNWEIYNASGTTVFTSTSPTVSYTFTDTGTYRVKLVINKDGLCTDSMSSLARVYPGFEPAFNFTGICVNKPTKFTDATTSVYGQVNQWLWDFGEFNDPNDIALVQHPVYTYPTLGNKNVRFIVSNTKGCIDTIQKAVQILDRPPIVLAFRDTLICVPDALQLKASGNGSFSWSPFISILQENTATPTVSPVTTTRYFVTLNDNGCLNQDSVLVRVVDHVTLKMMNDTIICQNDPITLHLESDGLRYEWSPGEQMANPLVANPVAITPANTQYTVIARIGSCSVTGDVDITAIPYPSVSAGADTMICFSSTAQLKGITNGIKVQWTPATSLSDPFSLTPIANPRGSTVYTIAAFDNKGCPKPAFDDMLVKVLPDIIASAGVDTAGIIGQPVQLRASGGMRYEWLPGEGLSASNIANPIATINYPSDGLRYKVLVYNEAECVDSAFLKLKIFKSQPTVFVPSAFSPNGDGSNDIFRFIAAGIKTIEQFQVFNRWGQMVYSNATPLPGWDGTVGGKPQAAGTYVWSVKAIDFMGRSYMQKGIVVLVR